MTRKETMSIRNVMEIPGLEALFSYDSEGSVTGVSVSADGGFYVRVNYNPIHKKNPWKFTDPSPLPPKCRAHHFTLRHLIHRALNWMDVPKEVEQEK